MRTGISDVHPPTPILTFRVGVVGHRPNRLPSDIEPLRLVIRGILEVVRQGVRDFHAAHPGLHAPDNAVLRVVSPLAEGADRLLGEEGINLGFQLHCPMPFHQQEYEADFVSPRSLTSGSLDAFRSLLTRATASAGLVRFECDGDREAEDLAYGATGRIVLNHSDLLIAIWDGGPARGHGGTMEKIEEAVRFRVPIIWVDAVSPHSWRVIRTEQDIPRSARGTRATSVPNVSNNPAVIHDLVDAVLCPPGVTHLQGKGERSKRSDLREAYFRETRPTVNWAFLWKWFRDLVGDRRLRVPSVRAASFEQGLGDDWPQPSEGITDRIDLGLRRHYAWADGLADFYADRYRSAFVFGYLFAVLAVLVALLPFTFASQGAGHNGTQDLAEAWITRCALMELLVIVSILFVIGASWRRRWHERWMDYRLVAELVRQLGFLLPLGGGNPFPRVPPFHAGYGDPAQTWMYWHVRAVERDVGLQRARLGPHYLAEALGSLKLVLGSQRSFHETTHARSERIAHRLHATGYVLFVLTLLVCIAHLLLRGSVFGMKDLGLLKGINEPWLPVLCAVFPALGAALAGINNQGEFGRVAMRSQAMAERLGQLDQRADELLSRGADLRAADVTALAHELAQLTVDEVLDWRVVFKDRPPVLPA